jgi:hypothetical protein
MERTTSQGSSTKEQQFWYRSRDQLLSGNPGFVSLSSINSFSLLSLQKPHLFLRNPSDGCSKLVSCQYYIFKLQEISTAGLTSYSGNQLQWSSLKQQAMVYRRTPPRTKYKMARSDILHFHDANVKDIQIFIRYNFFGGQ